MCDGLYAKVFLEFILQSYCCQNQIQLEVVFHSLVKLVVESALFDFALKSYTFSGYDLHLAAENIKEISDSGKWRRIDKMLAKIIEKGNKVLILSQFTSMLDLLEVYMRIGASVYKRLDGSTPTMERQAMINELKNDAIFSFFLGLLVQEVLHDIDFNPYNDKQDARSMPNGQKKQVLVTKIISYDTVEVDIQTLARKKLQPEKAVMDGIKGQNEEIEETSRAFGSVESKEEKIDKETLNQLPTSALKRKSTV